MQQQIHKTKLRRSTRQQHRKFRWLFRWIFLSYRIERNARCSSSVPFSFLSLCHIFFLSLFSILLPENFFAFIVAQLGNNHTQLFPKSVPCPIFSLNSSFRFAKGYSPNLFSFNFPFPFFFFLLPNWATTNYFLFSNSKDSFSFLYVMAALNGLPFCEVKPSIVSSRPFFTKVFTSS